MCKILMLFTFCTTSCLWAESDSPLVAAAQNYIQVHGVNVSFESTISSELTPFCLQDLAKQNIKAEPKWQTHISFCADKNRFNLVVSRLGLNKNTSSFSFDGTSYAAIHGLLHDMTVSKKNSKVPPAVWNSNSLLLPAGMFGQNTYKQIDCLWQTATDASFWNFVSSSFSIPTAGQASGVINGDKIKVTLSDKNAFLGVSSIESNQGNSDARLMRYTCTETGTVTFVDDGQKRTFFYPKKATLQVYESTGELLKTDLHEISKITVNDPNFDDSKFFVDPASVGKIYDDDAKVWITIPK